MTPGSADGDRQAILRAAYRLVGREGPTASVHDILAEAGLSTRAFYRHFSSKDDLILDMYRTAHDRVAAELARVIAEANDPVDALRAWVHHYLAVAYDNRRAAQSKVLSSPEARSAAGFRAAQVAGLAATRRILADVLDLGARSGRFGSADPELDALAIQSVVGGFVDARLHGEPGPTWDDARDYVCDLFLRALVADQRLDTEV